MSRCGRCHGRGHINPIRGIGQIDCPACKGHGVKLATSTLGSRTVSVPLPAGARCKVCNEPAVANHHVVSQSRLKRFLLAGEVRDAQEDIRNVVPLCHRCHDRVESGALELAEHELHVGFWRFVAKYELIPALPRHLADACGAASFTASVRGRSVSRTPEPPRETPDSRAA